jgi:hypothetical protein
MDTSLIKPTARTARTGFPTSRVKVVRGTAPTELPSSQSVTATPAGHDGTMRDEHAQTTAGEILMDAETREAISRAASLGSDRLPATDAALKLLAYRRTDSDHEPETHSLERNV